MARRRTVILISGRGSNMAALVAAAADPAYPAGIAGVVSDNPEAAGLKIAAMNRIETRAIPRAGHADRASHEMALQAALEELGAEIVCLAGYMRMLSAGFVDAWQGRMINIHPSLLPSFKGLDTHARALAAGVRIHGCTVHFVTPQMDDGPIIAQAAVPVLAEDDADSLAARVLKAEHRLYPLALKLLAEGAARMEAGRAVLDGVPERAPRRTLVVPEVETVPADLEELARFTP